jgi:hypothetical protein
VDAAKTGHDQRPEQRVMHDPATSSTSPVAIGLHENERVCSAERNGDFTVGAAHGGGIK